MTNDNTNIIRRPVIFITAWKTAVRRGADRIWERLQAYAKRRADRVVIQHLRTMSDAQLRDIGIPRSEIEHAFRNRRLLNPYAEPPGTKRNRQMSIDFNSYAGPKRTRTPGYRILRRIADLKRARTAVKPEVRSATQPSTPEQQSGSPSLQPDVPIAA